MSRPKSLTWCWLALTLLLAFLPTESFSRRLRVKTIANITAETTTTATLVSPPPTALVTDDQTTYSSEVISSPIPAKRRQRPPRVSTTQEPVATTRVSIEESSEESNGGFGKRIARNGNNNYSSVGSKDDTFAVPVRGGGRRNGQASDVTPSQSSPKLLVQPRENAMPSSVYSFVTGRVRTGSNNLNASVANDIPDQKLSPNELYKVKDDSEDVAVTLPPKRYSSRYRGPRPGATKTYTRGNHKEEEPLIVPPEETHTEEAPGLLSDGDYKQVGETPEEETGTSEEHEGITAEIQDASDEQKDDDGKDGGIVKESKGAGEEHQSDLHTVKGAKGAKGYKGGHQFHKGAKGFHNKEGHKGEYKDEKGNKKSHKEGGGHFESGHHLEKGEKAAEHAEREEYKKGHSTRGGHVIHKKDEYEKKMEFYDESHEDGSGEKFGVYFESHGGKKGGHKKGGHKNGKSDGADHGKKGHFAKGSHHSDDKGHDKKEGKAGMHEHHEKFGKEGSKKDAKTYHYSQSNGKPKHESGTGKKAPHVETETETDSGKEETPEQEKYCNNDSMEDDSIDKNSQDSEEVQEHVDDRALKQDSEEQELLVDEETDNPHRKLTSEKEIYKKAEYVAQEGPIVFYRKGEINNSPQENEASKKSYKNVQYMDEDGPTAVYVGNRATSPALTRSEEDGGYHDGRHSQHSSPGLAPDRDENSQAFTEEQLLEDKEGEEALHVFSPVHQDDDHEYEESQQGYKVAELQADQEPARQESKIQLSKVQIHSTYHPVQIVAMYKLPPIE